MGLTPHAITYRRLGVPPHSRSLAPGEAADARGGGCTATRARDPHTEVSRIRVPVASLQGASARQHTQLAVLEEGIFGGHSRDPPAATPVEKASLQEKPAQQHPWRCLQQGRPAKSPDRRPHFPWPR